LGGLASGSRHPVVVARVTAAANVIAERMGILSRLVPIRT
jgi:hypothetical protein